MNLNTFCIIIISICIGIDITLIIAALQNLNYIVAFFIMLLLFIKFYCIHLAVKDLLDKENGRN